LPDANRPAARFAGACLAADTAVLARFASAAAVGKRATSSPGLHLRPRSANAAKGRRAPLPDANRAAAQPGREPPGPADISPVVADGSVLASNGGNGPVTGTFAVDG
jgi:hypothetical protein